jgi:hypothetical protein
MDYAEIVARYDEAVKGAGLERHGNTMPYTSLNGNMFSYVDKDGSVAIRLPKPDLERLRNQYGADVMASYGAVMKEYLKVPEAVVQDPVELLMLVRMSWEYAETLKAKATTKKKG